MSKIIEKFSTPYGEYVVAEEWYNDRQARVLLSPSGAPQSGIGLDDEPEQLFMYNQRFMEIAVGLRLERVLVIGGGSFTFPSALVNQLGVTVDVVEINPALPGVAEKHFGLSQSESLKVYIEDGFEHIKKSDVSYGYIVIDAFMDRTAPDSLMSEAAAVEYRRLLCEGGVVAINCISRYHTWSDTLLKTLVRNLKTEFNYVDVYPAEPGREKREDQNLVVVASDISNDRHDYLQSYPVEVLGL